MYSWTIAFATLLALGTLLAPSVVADAASHRSFEETMTSKTFSRTAILKVRSVNTENRIRFKAEIESGTIAWVVKDPSGRVRWSESLSDGSRASLSQSFLPITGDWTLEVRGTNVTGHVRYEWNAR